MNEDILAANEKLTARLSESIEAGSIFHAYIFVSSDLDAAETFAKAFIKGILLGKRMDHDTRFQTERSGDQSTEDTISAKVDEDRHEDVIVIRKSGSTTRIDSIRNMQSKIGVRAIGDRHIVLIADGDEMREEAQNALLKTLEEPPGDTVLIILSENVENLLPTVRSRSIVCQIDEGDSRCSEKMREIAGRVMEEACEGAAYYRLKKETEKIGDSREDLRRFIDVAEEICRDRIFMRDSRGMPINQEMTAGAIRALEDARNKLDRGMSPKNTIKDILLRIGG